MDSLNQRPYFFDHGLYFQCRQCGGCCTGSPGIIYVEPAEIACIARFLKLPEPDFISDYLYPCRQSYSIREHADGRCFFYENGCRIYPVRPRQCKTFPFWFRNLRSEQTWKAVSRQCPGIGGGRFFSKQEIIEIIDWSI
ncbi:MAG: YkgJ family cysteine cluster protein [Desulfobacterales bacterium]|nr:YkgJ family cysteine cluster protein [Desulfobacterales bacterium]MDD4391888.1 YkgJ family cysteine cluster protein [Desulfobacterales bacterium]